MSNEESKQATANTTAVVAYTHKDALGKIQLNIDAFPVKEKKQLTSLNSQLISAMQEYGASLLKMGKILFDIRKILENRGDAMKGFVNSIPGMSQATAYRRIAMYEMATKNIPQPLVNRVLTTGIEMVGVTEEKPYGKYTDVIKKMEKNTTSTHIKDCTTDEKAKQFLHEVVANYEKMPKGGTRDTTSTDDLYKQATNYVKSIWNRLPDSEKKPVFLQKLFGYIIDSTGMDHPMQVSPLKPPSHWAPPEVAKKKTGRKKKTDRPEGIVEN